MKDKNNLWIWCLINSVLIILLGIIVSINFDYDERYQDVKINNIETDVNSIKDWMQSYPDTVTIKFIYDDSVIPVLPTDGTIISTDLVPKTHGRTCNR